MTSIPLDSQSFSDEDFRFRLGTVPGSPEEFFAWSTDSAAVLAERRVWFAANPLRYAALLPEGAAIAQELLESVASWPMLRDAPRDLCSPGVSLFERLVMLSEQWEPDFVLLAPRRQTSPANSHHDEPLFTVAGGCVCFPSAWRLTDKLGQTVDQVHQPVASGEVPRPIQLGRLPFARTQSASRTKFAHDSTTCATRRSLVAARRSMSVCPPSYRRRRIRDPRDSHLLAGRAPQSLGRPQRRSQSTHDAARHARLQTPGRCPRTTGATSR
jgi:hypothetical protein